MTNPLQILQPSLESQSEAMFLAVVVRNAMEGFHTAHLSDEQMKALNPIIRNAIYTGLQALRHFHDSKAAKSFVEERTKHIPKYWENPELLKGFLNDVKRMDGEE